MRLSRRSTGRRTSSPPTTVQGAPRSRQSACPPGLAPTCPDPGRRLSTLIPPAGTIGKTAPSGNVITSDDDFVTELLETKAAVVLAFGLAPHFRISYATATRARGSLQAHPAPAQSALSNPADGGRFRKGLAVFVFFEGSSARLSPTAIGDGDGVIEILRRADFRPRARVRHGW